MIEEGDILMFGNPLFNASKNWCAFVASRDVQWPSGIVIIHVKETFLSDGITTHFQLSLPLYKPFETYEERISISFGENWYHNPALSMEEQRKIGKRVESFDLEGSTITLQKPAPKGIYITVWYSAPGEEEQAS